LSRERKRDHQQGNGDTGQSQVGSEETGIETERVCTVPERTAARLAEGKAAQIERGTHSQRIIGTDA